MRLSIGERVAMTIANWWSVFVEVWWCREFHICQLQL